MPPQPGTTFASMSGRSLSEEVERSPLGQLVISALIVLILLVEIGTNLPASAVQRSVGPTSGQISFLLGNEQAWGVFAPDPRSTSLQLEGRVTFADGSHATWHLPTGSPWGEPAVLPLAQVARAGALGRLPGDLAADGPVDRVAVRASRVARHAGAARAPVPRQHGH